MDFKILSNVVQYCRFEIGQSQIIFEFGEVWDYSLSDDTAFFTVNIGEGVDFRTIHLTYVKRQF